ncbi:hypothetical protein ACFFJX_08010 [Pseudarcicella hirudinis]|uniref:hypothetical protein n=1 Tax=Pseudarcicella hirudinis TaxID=1079859 RepID=UPI0035EB0F0A
MLDANTEFLRWNTKVSYDSGSTFVQYKAPEWQINQKTAVRAIVNRPKNLIAIYAVQPYGVEQSSVIVKYDQNGYNWQRQIDVRAGVNELYIFKLNDI